MTPILVSGPGAEPLTLPEANAWLRLDTDEEDAIVLSLVTAARMMIEREARRLLMTQSWQITTDCWPENGILTLPIGPVASISAIRVSDSTGVATLLPTETYRLEAARDPALIILTGAPPRPGQSIGGIEIDLICGFGDEASDVPEPLRHAIRLLVARWFEHRGDAGAGSLPADVGRLISPFRRRRL